MRRQQGFTLIEILLVAGLASVVAIGGFRAAASLNRQAEFRTALEEAHTLAVAADSFRRRVASSVVTPGAPATYTYRDYATWTPASTLATDTNNTTLPTATPWGAAYEVMTNDATAIVRYRVPADRDPLGRVVPNNTRVTALPGGEALIEIAPIARPVDRLSGRTRTARALNGEHVR